ncbi:AAA family ATPase [Roseateles sp. So40a]|uniref:AAA family ATPase n=1 Tax=Roseateles sp. So40a TaxID=3400226 RepID=UPI003A897847
MTAISDAARELRAALHAATTGLVGREPLAELIVLAAVAQEHLLVVGPPGTGKSAVVRRVAQALGGRYFEYLLGRFTEPTELFGPVDLRKLREGTVETDVTGMLPEADVAFLDEVFLGSTAILNTLLGVLNERRFRRGHTQLACPLRVCVGAANGLPEDEALAAFADRFLLHAFVEPVPDEQLESLLEGGWRSDFQAVDGPGAMVHLDLLGKHLKEVRMDAVRPVLAEAIRQLRAAGLRLSDRRIVKAQRLIAAAAVLAGRLEALPADLWPLRYVLPTQQAQLQARDVLKAQLAHAEHPHLRYAVEEAAMQPLSRVGRLIAQAQACLSAAVDAANGHPAITSVLREIDANFAPEQLPAELAAAREQLLARLRVEGASGTIGTIGTTLQ